MSDLSKNSWWKEGLFITGIEVAGILATGICAGYWAHKCRKQKSHEEKTTWTDRVKADVTLHAHTK